MSFYRSNWGRTRPITDADPGDETPEQLELDVPKVCTCGAVRVEECLFTAKLQSLQGPPGKRPRACLRRVDPSKTEIPF